VANEYFVDNLKNFWAQGDVITLTFDRLSMIDGQEEPVGEAVVKLTMKGQNLVNMTNALNNILSKIKEKNATTGKNETPEEADEVNEE
jgi:hypothetical protein